MTDLELHRLRELGDTELDRRNGSHVKVVRAEHLGVGRPEHARVPVCGIAVLHLEVNVGLGPWLADDAE